MNKTSFFFAVICLLTSLSAFAEVEEKSPEQVLNEMRLEKMQADILLSKMVETGRMSDADVKKAKREIASIHEEGLNDLKEATLKDVNSSVSLATK